MKSNTKSKIDPSSVNFKSSWISYQLQVRSQGFLRFALLKQSNQRVLAGFVSPGCEESFEDFHAQ